MVGDQSANRWLRNVDARCSTANRMALMGAFPSSGAVMPLKNPLTPLVLQCDEEQRHDETV